MMKRLTLLGISFYRKWISPLLPRACRFEPTCSGYAEDCFRRLKWWRAARLTLGRLLRCQPFHPGGLDPAPDR